MLAILRNVANIDYKILALPHHVILKASVMLHYKIVGKEYRSRCITDQKARKSGSFRKRSKTFTNRDAHRLGIESFNSYNENYLSKLLDNVHMDIRPYTKK